MGTEDIGNASKKTCPDMIRAVKNGLNRHIDDVRVSLLGAGTHDLSTVMGDLKLGKLSKATRDRLV